MFRFAAVAVLAFLAASATAFVAPTGARFARTTVSTKMVAAPVIDRDVASLTSTKYEDEIAAMKDKAMKQLDSNFKAGMAKFDAESSKRWADIEARIKAVDLDNPQAIAKEMEEAEEKA